MRILQRMVLVVGTVMLVFLGTVFGCLREKEKLCNQWEHVLVEKFLSKLCSTGKFTTVDYQQLYTGLKKSRLVTGIEIEEYCREEDIKGNRYYFLIPWEEREEELLGKGYCTFENGSIVRIRIKQSNKDGISGNSYWDIITGKEN